MGQLRFPARYLQLAIRLQDNKASLGEPALLPKPDSGWMTPWQIGVAGRPYDSGKGDFPAHPSRGPARIPSGWSWPWSGYASDSGQKQRNSWGNCYCRMWNGRRMVRSGGVSRDRVPSVHDPEMRHGRKISQVVTNLSGANASTDIRLPWWWRPIPNW